MKNNTQQFSNTLKLSTPGFGLLKTTIDRALRGRDLRPKDRSLFYEQFRQLNRNIPHATEDAFKVYAWFSENQASEHGTRVWADNSGREYEVSHVAYVNTPPDRYPDAEQVPGCLVKFIRNARESLLHQQRVADRQRQQVNQHNLGPVAEAFPGSE